MITKFFNKKKDYANILADIEKSCSEVLNDILPHGDTQEVDEQGISLYEPEDDSPINFPFYSEDREGYDDIWAQYIIIVDNEMENGTKYNDIIVIDQEANEYDFSDLPTETQVAITERCIIKLHKLIR